VDVREWEEVNETAFDVPDILVIPMSELENRWSEIPRDRDVIIVCAAGVRSLKVTYYLMNRGYDKVMNMEYGMQRWLQKHFPVKGKKFLARCRVLLAAHRKLSIQAQAAAHQKWMSPLRGVVNQQLRT
jgi:rhodanese-related sulfurtransferase